MPGEYAGKHVFSNDNNNDNSNRNVAKCWENKCNHVGGRSDFTAFGRFWPLKLLCYAKFSNIRDDSEAKE